jgi:aspartokinase
MALIVQKFGGTSFGSIERIRNVAWRVAERRACRGRLPIDLIAVFHRQRR